MSVLSRVKNLETRTEQLLKQQTLILQTLELIESKLTDLEVDIQGHQYDVEKDLDLMGAKIEQHQFENDLTRIRSDIHVAKVMKAAILGLG